jgi:hypothetical protein
VEGDKPNTRKFKSYPIGYFHIDIAEVRTAEGKLYLFVAIDRTSKFAFVELHEKAITRVSGDFLRHLIAAVPYKVHTVLTDNGIHFTTPGAGGSAAPLIKEAIANGERFRAHSFESLCHRSVKNLRAAAKCVRRGCEGEGRWQPSSPKLASRAIGQRLSKSFWMLPKRCSPRVASVPLVSMPSRVARGATSNSSTATMAVWTD